MTSEPSWNPLAPLPEPGLPAQALAPAALFVTGTDTGVGKTHVSRLVARAWREAGIPVAAIKIIASGAVRRPDGRWDQEDARLLGEASSASAAPVFAAADTRCGEALVTLSRPMAPLSAAVLDGVTVEFAALRSRVVAAAQCAQRTNTRLLLEGVGGPLVPICPDGRTISDLVAGLGIPALVVGRLALGTISHTLLAVEALERCGIVVAAVVLSRSQPDWDRDVERSSFTELRRFLKVPIGWVDFEE